MAGNQIDQHECIIGMYYDYDNTELVKLSDLKEKEETEKELYKTACLDPIYYKLYHDRRIYTLQDYLDKRKKTCLRRFEYCPDCGEKIDWRGLARNVRQGE